MELVQYKSTRICSVPATHCSGYPEQCFMNESDGPGKRDMATRVPLANTINVDRV